MKQENETGSLFKHCVHDEDGETIPRYNGKYPQENGHTCNGNTKVSCYTYLCLLQVQCIEKINISLEKKLSKRKCRCTQKIEQRLLKDF